MIDPVLCFWWNLALFCPFIYGFILSFVLFFCLKMINIGCSERRTCFQGTHSLCMNTGEDFPCTKSTQPSGGSPVETPISLQETGTVPNIRIHQWIQASLAVKMFNASSVFRYWCFSEDTRTTDRESPKPISTWGRIPHSPKGAFLSEDGGKSFF